MFEELMQLIQQHGQTAVVNNPEVPDEHNEAIMQEAHQSILTELQNVVSSGNFSHITDMLQGNNTNLTDNISGNFAANIAQKFGINPTSAQNIASSLIPTVLGAFSSKMQGATGGNFDIQSMIGSFSSGGFQSTLNNFGSKMGLDKDGDGDVDLGDITKMFGK